jgi:N-acetylglutamate synthase-like GNAT family acetyltransferase
MNNMYTVKEVKNPGELSAVLDLRYRILREPWQQPAATASDGLEEKSVNAFISDDDGKAIACGRLQENEGKVGQIRFMAVDDKYQGKGLGKLIVDFLEQRGKSLGLQRIELQARENAVKFYESCGYSVKEKSFLLWDIIQHYLMEKKI